MASGKIGATYRIEWNIVDFCRLAKIKSRIDSPKFSFEDSDVSWYLQCIPGWKEQEYMSIYLCRNRVLDYDVEFSFELKIVNGRLVPLGTGMLRKFEKTCGIRYFIRLKDVLFSSTWMPNNTFTIICSRSFRTEIADSNQELVLKETTSELSKLDKLSENLKNFFSDKDSCDVTLKVKDKEYKAHKSILTARSSVFAACFKYDTLEKQTGIITIPDCDPESFQEFLEYLYCGRLEQISTCSAMNLYYTSDKYDVGELKEFCIEYLMKNLTVGNVCEVATFANKCGQTQLYSAVQDFFNEHACKIYESSKSEWEKFLQKDYHLAIKILKNVLEAKVKK